MEDYQPASFTATLSDPRKDLIGLIIIVVGSLINLLHVYQTKEGEKAKYHISMGPPGRVKWSPFSINREIPCDVNPKEIVIKMFITFVLSQLTLLTFDLAIFAITSLLLIFTWKLFEQACKNKDDDNRLAKQKEKLKAQKAQGKHEEKKKPTDLKKRKKQM
ncbi:Schizosaccharomyces specific protein [Schizosaccharomyces osmophilus]|uniref:Schizosaccharomyces specific protein n=1 Tax=Schizosaccharomyces osmophilus TaxID=2545709 RepID=A0AAF0AVG9_9SCHI|nr:Schizosaccharomyces specific protein [Schizosaccharomyces osmophilus]WBW72527.1 Schizosaccharomyces specific protein [Schizosaccharomyces osmophilus]